MIVFSREGVYNNIYVSGTFDKTRTAIGKVSKIRVLRPTLTEMFSMQFGREKKNGFCPRFLFKFLV